MSSIPTAQPKTKMQTKTDKKAVVLKYLFDKPEIETVRFHSNHNEVHVLTHAQRGDGGEVPWWKHLGTIETVYTNITGEF